ncbi:MAG: glycosyltransferase family 9 protein [bacterium]
MQKALVFHGGGLGDLVNTLPAFRALRERFSGASFTCAGNLSFLSLFRDAGIFDQVVSIDGSGLHALWSESGLSPSIEEHLESHQLVVTWMRSQALQENLARLGLRVAAFAGPFPPPPGSGPVSDYMKAPLYELGIKSFPERPSLSLPPEVKRNSPSFPGLLVHPGSGSRHKNWPPEFFAGSAREIARRECIKIAVVAGPADRAPAAELIRLLGDDLEAEFRDLGTTGLAGLLSSAGLVLGNDSGVLHLAGALGTRVAAIFGPTDPAIWGVNQKNAVNLSPDLPCAPCSREDMRECALRQCLHAVPPEEVVEEVCTLMEHSPL